MRYYDKQGNPMSDALAWTAKQEGKDGYKRVAETTLPEGKWISTVWVGLNYNFDPHGRILIFETMVFSSEDSYIELDMDRYSTLEEAEAGHIAMVKKWGVP